MKKILRRSTLIYIVALAFIGGLGYLAFELVTGADDWVDYIRHAFYVTSIFPDSVLARLFAAMDAAESAHFHYRAGA